MRFEHWSRRISASFKPEHRPPPEGVSERLSQLASPLTLAHREDPLPPLPPLPPLAVLPLLATALSFRLVSEGALPGGSTVAEAAAEGVGVTAL